MDPWTVRRNETIIGGFCKTEILPSSVLTLQPNELTLPFKSLLF